MFAIPFGSQTPFGFKIHTYSYALAHVNVECQKEKYPKIKVYKSKVILGSCEYQ